MKFSCNISLKFSRRQNFMKSYITNCARWRPSSPPQIGGGALSPIFGPCRLWPNGWMDQDGAWHGGEPWSRPHCARWGPSSPRQKGADPQFSAYLYFCQTAGCIKMPLGMVTGLSPGNFVLDVDPASPPKGRNSPIFGPRLLWPNRCIDQDATNHLVRR